MSSVSKKENDINHIMNSAARTYGRINYDNGLAFTKELPKYRLSIMAGLMENNYVRYCNEFPPNENPEEFANVFIQTFQLKKEYVNDAFDKAISFFSFSSSVAMEFFLKIHDRLDNDRKNKCEERVKELLNCKNTIEYVRPITNWAYFLHKCTVFMEDCILMLVQGLGKDNSDSLASVDKALVPHCGNRDFLIKLIICVAENLEPTDVLNLEKCINSLNKNKKEFLNFVLSFILHPKSLYRLTGRKLWDDYKLETSDFEAGNLNEIQQIVFIISMLQDYGNPKRRLPKLLPLLTKGSDKVRSVLMCYIQPYVDEYMGHVINVLDALKIDCEEGKVIRTYVNERANCIKLRCDMKELSPMYTYENVFREAIRQQNKHLQEQIKDVEASYKSIWNDMFSTVILARGGGWRDENGKTQHLSLTTYSVPSRLMKESMSPKEQDEWWNQLMKDWDDKTGDY